MRTSARGDIQGKLAAAPKGEWCAAHDRGRNELIKSLLGLSRAGLFLSISGFLWGLVEMQCWGKSADIGSGVGLASLCLYMVDGCSGR